MSLSPPAILKLASYTHGLGAFGVTQTEYIAGFADVDENMKRRGRRWRLSMRGYGQVVDGLDPVLAWWQYLRNLVRFPMRGSLARQIHSA